VISRKLDNNLLGIRQLNLMELNLDFLHTISNNSVFWLGQVSLILTLLTGFSFNAAIKIMSSSEEKIAENVASYFIFSAVFLFLATIFVMGDLMTVKQVSTETSQAIATSKFEKANELAKTSGSFAGLGALSLLFGMVRLGFLRSLKLGLFATIATIICIVGFIYFLKLFGH
jgi:hypothetical protein